MERSLTITTEAKDHPDGFLEVFIYEAENLPNTDASILNLFGSKTDVTDPIASIDMGGINLAKTRCIDNDLNPVWNEHSVLPLYGNLNDVVINVLDDDLVGTDEVASVTFKIEQFTRGDKIDGWFDLINKKGKKCGKIRVAIQHFPNTANSRLLRDNYRTDAVSMNKYKLSLSNP